MIREDNVLLSSKDELCNESQLFGEFELDGLHQEIREKNWSRVQILVDGSDAVSSGGEE